MKFISKFIKIYFLVLIPLMAGAYTLCSLDTYEAEVEIKISHDLVSQYKNEKNKEFSFTLKSLKKYNTTSLQLIAFRSNSIKLATLTLSQLNFQYESLIKEKSHLKLIRARSPTFS